MTKQFWQTWQTEIRFGLLVVGIGLLWMVGENILLTIYQRPEWGNITGTLALIVPIAGYWMMLANVRDREKSLSWKQALRSGGVMTLTVALIGAIVIYLYAAWVPQPIDLYIEYLRSQYQVQGLGEDEIEAGIATVRIVFTPPVQALSAVIGALFSGAILTPAITLMLRRKKMGNE